MRTSRALALSVATATAVGLTALPAAHAAPTSSTDLKPTAAKRSYPRPALTSPTALADAVAPAAVVSHLAAFERIAHASNGRRAAGERGYELSAQYVEQQLRAAGYTPRRQPFEITYDSVVSTSLDVVSPTKRAVPHAPFTYSPSTAKTGVQGRLVSPATPTGCSAAEWGATSATGMIALVQRGTCTFAEKVTAAKAAGAAAVLVSNNDAAQPTQVVNGTLGGPSPDYVPATGISKADGDALRAEMAAGPVELRFVLDKIVEKRTTFNILAETKGGSAKDVLMVGAHLDSVQAGPGINDNASGAAGVLEVAKQTARLKHPAKKVRFAFWGAEEIGLLGSEHYVENLQENDLDGLLSISGYLNFDMLASPNYVIGVYDGKQPYMPEGSVALQRAFTNYFDDLGQPYVAAAMRGSSDHAPFLAAGIPSGGIFTGAGGLKTPEEVAMFGGVAGKAYDPNYHTPQDNLRNLSKPALAVNVKAVGYAVGTLALGEPRPARVAKAVRTTKATARTTLARS